MKSLTTIIVILAACYAGIDRVRAQEVSRQEVEFVSGGSRSEVPFTISSNLVIVQASVNGSRPGFFILDTGAESSVIDAEFAKEISLRSSGTTVGTGSAGTARAGVIKKATLQLGDVRASNLTLYSLPLGGFTPGLGLKAAGIIGNDLLGKVVVQLDYAAGLVTLHRRGTLAPPASADVVPITMEGNLPFIQTQVQPVGRGPMEAKCELDTGSTGSLLFNSPFVTKHRLVSSLPRSMASRSGGVGGTGRSVVGRFASIKLGRSTINSPIAVLFRGTRGDNASDEYDCLIGGAIFSRFKITFDMPGGRVYLEPTAALGEAFETDMSGIELLADGSDLTTILIDEVNAHSAAAKAGVRGGDVLQAVNDKPASELGLREIRRLFQEHGASHELTLRRGKRTLKVQIYLKRVI